MTEVGVESAEQQDGSTTPPPASAGAGQLLRQARERQQMSVQTVASTLKVPVYKLQALEEDRWDVLTDSVFTRALALSVCRLLQIAPEPVLAGLPRHEATKLSSNPEGINAPFKEKTLRSLMTPAHENNSGNAVKLAVVLLLALAVGAGLYFVPQWQSGEEVDTVAAVGVGQEAATDANEPLFMPQLQTAPEAPAGELLAGVADAAVENLGAATAPASVAAVAAAPAAEAAAPVVAPTPVASGRVLRFTAAGESWVQVRDAQQQVVMEKILKAGDVYEEAAVGRPLHVVVGNAGVTKVEIDGAVLDVAASVKNNVARFEVK